MNQIRLTIAIFFMVIGCLLAHSQAVRVVSAEYTFYGDGNHSPADCRREALQGARLAAIAKEFGTTITQSVVSDEVVNARGENTFFRSLSETEVKGEWLEDIGEPVFTPAFDGDGNLIMTCFVKGRAREISNKAPDFQVSILRNGTDLRYADTRFNSGDDMRLYFKAPVDGYMAVYLTGEDNMAYTMLPYTASPDGYVKIKHGREYVFFDAKKGDALHGEVDEMQLVTDEQLERDRFYILFSPQPFIKANDSFSGDNLPRSLPFAEFSSWLAKTRKNDPSLGVKTIDITISSEK
ncbi:MAG: DUF4384 domain-containing protein [Muribaculaceae bacterium]|nr:DUF4384 domain-containing protein [Muribaculaceae bacterium]